MSDAPTDDPHFRNGTAARNRALYCGSVIACVAMLCITWGPAGQATTIIGFAGTFLFQFWNYLKGDSTHATATAAAMSAREAASKAQEAAKAAADAVLVNAANFTAIKKASAEVKADIKASDDRAEPAFEGRSGEHAMIGLIVYLLLLALLLVGIIGLLVIFQGWLPPMGQPAVRL